MVRGNAKKLRTYNFAIIGYSNRENMMIAKYTCFTV